jgi:hypothetical protein
MDFPANRKIIEEKIINFLFEIFNLQVAKKEYRLNKIKVHKVILKYNYKNHYAVEGLYEILNQHKFLDNNLTEEKKPRNIISVFCENLLFLPYFSVLRDALFATIDHSLDLTYESRSNFCISR